MYENDYDIDNLTHDELLAEIGLDSYTIRRLRDEADDEGYVDKQSGDRVEKTEWHRVVTFQPGLVDMFEKHIS